MKGQINFAVVHSHGLSIAVGNGGNGNRIQLGHAAPVILVCNQLHLALMIPGGDSEGAGSHRDCILGIQAFHIKDDGAMVNQIVCQRSINGGGLNSQGLTVRFHGIDFQHGLGTAIVISGSLQSSHNSSGITGLAIGEGHAVTDVELPGQLVNLLPGVSQPGDQLQVGADAGQGFANAQTVGFPACLQGIDGLQRGVPAHIQMLGSCGFCCGRCFRCSRCCGSGSSGSGRCCCGCAAVATAGEQGNAHHSAQEECENFLGHFFTPFEKVLSYTGSVNTCL